MSKNMWFLLAAVCVPGLAAIPALSQIQRDLPEIDPAQARAVLGPVDLTPAVPAPSELPGFAYYKTLSRHIFSPQPNYPAIAIADMHTTRIDDGLTLNVQIGVTTTPAEALELARRAVDTPGGEMPEGTPSGRPLGQMVWHSLYSAGGPPRGGYHLVVYDGRSVVIVFISAPIQGYENGKPVEALLSEQDLQMTENIAAACLLRAGYLGCTSQTALSASVRKQFISKRMALINAAKKPESHVAHK